MGRDRIAWVALAVAGLLLGLGVGRATAGAIVPCVEERAAERTLADLGNAVRENHGLAPLVLDPQLARVARTHTGAMIASGRLAHSSEDELASRITGWKSFSENVGIGSNARDLHHAFMHSRPHRANLLRARWGHVGIGALRDDLGRLWVTLVFEARTNPGTTLTRPDC